MLKIEAVSEAKAYLDQFSRLDLILQLIGRPLFEIHEALVHE